MAFPLDADGLADSQTNEALISALGNIGGEKYILSGLTAGTGFAGYVFLSTVDFPAGELLYVEPAAMMQSHLCLRVDPVDINASGYEFNRAYTKRTMYHGVPGSGVESFPRQEFVQIETNERLKSRIVELENEVKKISPEVVGSIKMWATHIIPENWLICAGQPLSTTEYKDLFAVLGYIYGGTGNNFLLPDLRGNSVFGYKSGDDKFGALNRKDGRKTHTLQPNEQGGFSFAAGSDDGDGSTGVARSVNRIRIQDQEISVDSIGSWQWSGTKHVLLNSAASGHENLPPYITLNFIIRAK